MDDSNLSQNKRFLTTLLCVIFLISPVAHGAKQPFVVVLDPGHGGEDHGTSTSYRGRKISEKTLTLRIARAVAAQLRRKGVQAILTRKSDQEVSLPERTALANRAKADLFLSIHLNSAHGRHKHAAEGVETFILNNTSDQTSKRLAELENKGFSTTLNEDPANADVALILKDLHLEANLAESKRLACTLQKRLVHTIAPGKRYRTKRRRIDRGVRQAMFYVLLGANMPSALVEAGFLTHPQDRYRLLTQWGRKQVANAITRGILQFKRQRGTRYAQRMLSKCQVR